MPLRKFEIRQRCRRAFQNGGNFAVAANGGNVRVVPVQTWCNELPTVSDQSFVQNVINDGTEPIVQDTALRIDDCRLRIAAIGLLKSRTLLPLTREWNAALQLSHSCQLDNGGADTMNLS